MTKFEHLTNLISKCNSHVPHMIVIKLAIHKIMDSDGEHKTRHTSSSVQNTWICSLAQPLIN